jgi:uncharacterized membrane protein YgcG
MEKIGKFLEGYAEKIPQVIVEEVNRKILYFNISTVAAIVAAIFTLFAFSAGALALTGVTFIARIYFGDQLKHIELLQFGNEGPVRGGNSVAYIFKNPIYIKFN